MTDFLVLKPRAFGLDISDFSIKIVNLQKARGFFDLSAWGETVLPEGLVKGGQIQDEKALAKIIRNSLAEVRGKKISTRWVILSLPEDQCFLRLVQMPRLTNEELEKTLPFEAENHIPLSLPECYLSFQVVEPLVNHLDHLDVLLAAAPRVLVDAYSRLLRSAGLRPQAFEVESLACSRALVKDNLAREPVLLLDLGAHHTNLIIFAGRSVRFTSSLPFSGEKLTRELAHGLGIPPEKAETLKIASGLEGFSVVKFQEKKGDEQLEKEVWSDPRAQEIFRQNLQPLAAGVRNFLDFYQTHTSHEHLPEALPDIRRIFLAGGAANLKNLDIFLGRELGLPIVLGNPWVNILEDPVSRVPEIYLRRSLAFGTVLGLALRGQMDDSD